MRHAGFALLAVVLASSTARATVYVWQDRAGALVLTNVASELRDAPHGPLVTYTTTESSVASPAAADDGAPPAAAGTAAPEGAPAAAAPLGDVAPEAAASRTGDGAGVATGAPRTLGEANAQHLIAAATNPTERTAVEPRALLEVAAAAEPPRVVVSIVGSSAGPLSTSDRTPSRAGDAGEASVRGGGATSLAGVLSSVAERVAGGMR